LKRISVPEDGVETLFGSYDENLKHFESLFNVRIRTQGHDILAEGESPGPENVERVVNQLSSLTRDGYKLSAADVKTAADLVAQDPAVDLREHFLKGSLTPAGKRRVAPKTINQRRYLDAIEAQDIVFGIGPAGTGKTYLAVAAAANALRTKKVERIILVRPAVEAGESLGFLPGDMQEKVDPYLRPMYDALADLMSFDKMRRYIELGVIEIAPLAFMRGRTLHNSYVILDEAQNTTVRQMKMFLTRMGVNSRAVITGDVTQIDLKDPDSSGLVKIQSILGSVADIKFIYFHPEDVVRHRLVRDIIRAFDSYHARQNGKHEDGVGTALDPAAHDAPPGEGTGGAGNGGPEGAAGPGGPEALDEGGMGRGPSL